MSFDLDGISNKLSNLTVYDVKSLYRQARNYALNVSEIEAKVDEATNSDPWGASTTLMWEIAQATHNYADFGEIMQAILRRFMEKEAHEWREIYKALVLLEYLVKNGAERVVDDARMHVSTIKILRNFYYVEPETAKDVGINVRQRAGELAELLSDVDRIRSERKKARANRAKFAGGGSGGDFLPGSGSGRYAGFSSDQYFGGSGFAASSSASATTGAGAGASYEAEYGEYDAGADERPSPRPAGRAPARQSSTSAPAKPTAQPAPAPAPVADLLDWEDSDDDKPLRPAPGVNLTTPAAAPAGNGKGKATNPLDDLGDFGDFAAPAAAPAAPAVPPLAPAAKQVPAPTASLMSTSTPTPAPKPTPATAAKPAASPAPAASAAPAQPAKANAALFDFLAPSQSGGRQSGPARTGSFASSSSSLGGAGSKPPTPSAQSAQPSGGFDDLWAAAGPKTSSAPKGPQTMAELAATKSSNAVWGSGTAQTQKPKDVFDFL